MSSASETSLGEARPPQADLMLRPEPSAGYAVERFAQGFLASSE